MENGIPDCINFDDFLKIDQECKENFCLCKNPKSYKNNNAICEKTEICSINQESKYFCKSKENFWVKKILISQECDADYCLCSDPDNANLTYVLCEKSQTCGKKKTDLVCIPFLSLGDESFLMGFWLHEQKSSGEHS